MTARGPARGDGTDPGAAASEDDGANPDRSRGDGTDPESAASADDGASPDRSRGDGASPDRSRGDGAPTPVDVEHAPPRVSQVLGLVAVLVGALATIPYATLAIPFGLSGVALVGGGLVVTHSRTWLSVGTGLVLFGAVVTGAYGAVPGELMLVGVGATILAWDVGQHGITIGQQLGRRPRSDRNLLVHAATSLVAVGAVSAVAYVPFVLAGEGRPASAVTLVVLGLVVAAWVYRS